MKLRKRALSVFLSLVMVVALLPVSSISAYADSLSDAKKAFTDKVTEIYNGTKLYKNVMPAYLAYLEACKAGAGDDEAEALVSATAAMQEFTSYKGSEVVRINGGTGYSSSNVIYAEDPGTLKYSNAAHGYVSWSNGILKYGGDVFIYQPSAVVLYDGQTDAKIPVLFAEQENEGRYRFRYGYVSESGARLQGNWYGHNTAARNGTSDNVNLVWPTSSYYSIPKAATYDSSTDDGYAFWDANDTSVGGHGSESDFYNFRNALVFTLDNGASYTSITNKDEYKGIANYKKLSRFEWNIHAYWYNNVTGNEHPADGDTRLYTRNPVYVINYKKLLDKVQITLSEKKDTYIKLADSTVKESFDSGNAIGFFGAFDTALSLNVTDTSKFDYASDTSAAVEKAANAIHEACIDLDEISSTAAAMSSIVNNINKYEAMMADNPYRYNLASTYEWYIKAKECFDAYIFGQKNTEESDSEFLSYLADVSNKFEAELTKFTAYATYTTDGSGNKKYTASTITGEYVPEEGEKFFDGDDKASSSAAAYYKSAEALNNVLYYPTVNKTAGSKARTTTGSKTHDGLKYNGDGDGTNHFEIFYPEETVLVYNGESNPIFPIMASVRNAHSGAGVTNYGIAAYPTDSTTLYGKSTQLELDTVGYHTQSVNGTKYTEGFFPFATSSDTLNMHDWFVETKYNENSTYAPPESSTFNIKTFSAYYSSSGDAGSSNAQYSKLKKHWKGIYIDGSTTLPLNWEKAWTVNTSSVTGSGAMYASPKEFWSRFYDIKCGANNGRNETTVLASALEFKANPFDGKTVNDGADYYTAVVNGPNWYHAWMETRATTDLNVEIITDTTSKIQVVNVIPAMEAKQRLLDSTDAQAILGAIFQYNKDSADVAAFLRALDEIGSFDPNNSKYNYATTTYDTPVYSTNQGVEDCCKDMAALADKVTAALNYIDTSKTSDDAAANDGKVNIPTDAESTSTSTDSLGDGWYDNLRKALLDPLEADSCTDTESTYYTTYVDALALAQNAVSYSATSKIGGGSGTDYASRYNGETIEDIAQKLIDAAADFDKANTKHTFSYEEEDEDQIADWCCANNNTHTHATTDMSVYNELDIAYRTIDPEAYSDFYSKLGNYYDDGDRENSNTSFVEVKTNKTTLNPQTFVDNEITELLTQINTVSGAGGGTSELNTYQTHFYVSVDGADPTLVADYTYDYGDVSSFDATSYIPSGATCYKWSVTVEYSSGKESTQTIYNKSNTLANFIQGEAKVTAYVNSASVADAAQVTIIGPTNATVEEFNASKSASVVFGTAADGAVSVTIDGKEHTINSTTAYNVTGITVGKRTNTESYDGKSYNTLSDLLDELGTTSLLIAPLYENAVSSEYTITAKGAQTAKSIESFATGNTVTAEAGSDCVVSDVKYDDKLRVTYTANSELGEFYGIVVNTSELAGGSIAHYVPISYSNTYDFRANSIMNFYPLYAKEVTKDGTTVTTFIVDDGNETKITNANDRYRISRHLPFVIDFMDKNNVSGKFVFRVAFTANIPEDTKITITEHGWAYFFTNNKDVYEAYYPGENDVKIGYVFPEKTIGEKTYKPQIYKQASTKNYDPVTHQYSFSSSNRTSFAFLLGRGYVKYTYQFTQEDEDGNIVTSAPIEAIEYGRADFYQHD